MRHLHVGERVTGQGRRWALDDLAEPPATSCCSWRIAVRGEPASTGSRPATGTEWSLNHLRNCPNDGERLRAPAHRRPYLGVRHDRDPHGQLDDRAGRCRRADGVRARQDPRQRRALRREPGHVVRTRVYMKDCSPRGTPRGWMTTILPVVPGEHAARGRPPRRRLRVRDLGRDGAALNTISRGARFGTALP